MHSPMLGYGLTDTIDTGTPKVVLPEARTDE